MLPGGARALPGVRLLRLRTEAPQERTGPFPPCRVDLAACPCPPLTLLCSTPPHTPGALPSPAAGQAQGLCVELEERGSALWGDLERLRRRAVDLACCDASSVVEAAALEVIRTQAGAGGVAGGAAIRCCCCVSHFASGTGVCGACSGPLGEASHCPRGPALTPSTFRLCCGSLKMRRWRRVRRRRWTCYGSWSRRKLPRRWVQQGGSCREGGGGGLSAPPRTELTLVLRFARAEPASLHMH